MNPPGTVISVIDDDEQVLSHLAEQIEALGYQARSFSCAEEFLEAWHQAPQPEVAIIDVCLPGMQGTQLLEELKNAEYPVAMIFVTGYGDIVTSVRTIKQGAIDYLEKPIHPDQLKQALEEAFAHLHSLTEHASIRQNCEQRYSKLTAREREVCELVARGLLNKQIASKLGIAEKTVKIHRGRMMHKLKISTVAHLVQFYLLFNPPTLMALSEDEFIQAE